MHIVRETNRGFAFIFGAGTLILLYRLFGNGWFDSLSGYFSVMAAGGDPAALMRGDGVFRDVEISPIQLLVELAIESVIAFGAVAVLTIKGVWYILNVVYDWFGQFASALLDYLRGRRDKNDPVVKKIEDRQLEQVEAMNRIAAYVKKLSKRNEELEKQLRNQIDTTSMLQTRLLSIPSVPQTTEPEAVEPATPAAPAETKTDA